MVRILLVDDSDYIRDTLRAILTYSGHDIVGEAANAREAVEKYKKLSPELVLLDIVLKLNNGEFTGLDALKEILRFNSKAEVLICSALNQQALINHAVKIGAKGFVAKPFQPEELIEAVRILAENDTEAKNGKQSKFLVEYGKPNVILV